MKTGLIYALFYCFVGAGGPNDGSYCRLEAGPYASVEPCRARAAMLNRSDGSPHQIFQCMSKPEAPAWAAVE